MRPSVGAFARAVRATALVGGAAMLLAGCVSPRPAAMLDAPDVETTLARYTADAATQQAALPDGTLTLAQAKDLALQQNPDMAAALSRIQRAQAAIQRARAAFAPTVDGSVSRTYSQLGPGAAGFGGDDAVTSDTWRVGVDATWTLYDWYRREHAYHAASYDAAATEAAYRDARRLLRDAVARTYYTVLLAEQDAVIATADRAFQEQQQSAAETRLQAQKGTTTDVLNFQIRANAAESRILTAQQTAAAARLALLELLGLPAASATPALVLDAVRPTPEQGQADRLAALALTQRPDLARYRRQIAQLESLIAARQAEKRPVIAAQGSAAMVQDEGNFPTDPGDDRSLSIGIVGSMNIWDGGARDADIAAAEADLATVREQLRSLQHQIISAVRQRLVDIDFARRQIALQERAVELSRRARDLETQRLDAGKTTITRINEVQRDLVDAENNLLRAQIALRLRIEELHTVLGVAEGSDGP